MGYVHVDAPTLDAQYMTFIKNSNKEDELGLIVTRQGIHLVQVTGRKYTKNEEGVKVAYLSRKIFTK